VSGPHLTCRIRFRSPALRVCYGGEFQKRSAGYAPPPPAFVWVCASPNRVGGPLWGWCVKVLSSGSCSRGFYYTPVLRTGGKAMRLHRLGSAPTHDSEWGGGGIEAPDQGALSSAARTPETVVRFREPFKRMALPFPSPCAVRKDGVYWPIHQSLCLPVSIKGAIL
jgi:hypothetical protein